MPSKLQMQKQIMGLHDALAWTEARRRGEVAKLRAIRVRYARFRALWWVRLGLWLRRRICRNSTI